MEPGDWALLFSKSDDNNVSTKAEIEEEREEQTVENPRCRFVIGFIHQALMIFALGGQRASAGLIARGVCRSRVGEASGLW